MNLIEIVSIPVSKQDVAKEFYLKIGFQLIIEAPMGVGNTWIQMGLAGTGANISLVNWFGKMPPGSMQGLVLKTEDIEKEVEELKAKGVDIKPIDDTPWGKFASFYDPDGNGLILRQE